MPANPSSDPVTSKSSSPVLGGSLGSLSLPGVSLFLPWRLSNISSVSNSTPGNLDLTKADSKDDRSSVINSSKFHSGETNF